MGGEQPKRTQRMVAATIAAALIARGNTAPEDIAEALRVYRACLDGLNDPQDEPQSPYPPATPEQEERIRKGLPGIA